MMPYQKTPEDNEGQAQGMDSSPVGDTPAEKTVPIEHQKMTRRGAMGRILGFMGAAAAGSALSQSTENPVQAQETEQSLKDRYQRIEQALKSGGDLSQFPPLPEETGFPISAQEWRATPRDQQVEILTGILKDYKAGELQIQRKNDGSVEVAPAKPATVPTGEEGSILDYVLGDITLPTLQAMTGAVDAIANAVAKRFLEKSAKLKFPDKKASLEELKQMQAKLQNMRFWLLDFTRTATSTSDRVGDALVLGKLLYNGTTFLNQVGNLSIWKAAVGGVKNAGSIAVYYGIKKLRRQAGFHAPWVLEKVRGPVGKIDSSKRSSLEQVSLNLEQAIDRLDARIAEAELTLLPEDEFNEDLEELIEEIREQEGTKKAELTLSHRQKAILRQCDAYRNMQSSAEFVPTTIQQIVAQLGALRRAAPPAPPTP